jgi:hypothetical protein
VDGCVIGCGCGSVGESTFDDLAVDCSCGLEILERGFGGKGVCVEPVKES